MDLTLGDFERIMREILYETRQARPDGSHVAPSVQAQDLNETYQAIDKLTKEINDLYSNIENLDGATGTLREEFQEQASQLSKELSSAKKVAAERKKRDKEDAKSYLTGGRSAQWTQKADNIAKTGNGLKNIFGEKSAMGKVGGGLTNFASKLGKLNGVLGGFQMALDVAGKAMQAFAEYQQFENKKQEVENQRQLSILQARGGLAKAQLQTEGQIAQIKQGLYTSLATQGNGIAASFEADSHKIMAQSLTDIKGGAFAAAESAIRHGGDILKFRQSEKYGKQIADAQIEAANAQLEATSKMTAATINTANVTAQTQTRALTAEQRHATENVAINAIPVVGDAVQDVVKGGQAVVNAEIAKQNIDEMFTANRNEVITSISSNLSATEASINANLKQSTAQMQQTIEQQKTDAAAQMEMAWLGFTQHIFDAFQKAETAAYKMGRAMNLSGEELEKYAQGMAHTQVVVSKWGKTLEDVAQMQMAYQEATGRNRQLSDADFEKSFANGMLVGDDVVAQMNAGMEIFNMSVADSNDMFYDMYTKVTKMGLSGKKFGKDLVQNLKLAEKYNFNKGVQGMAEMTVWAQNMRFNMGSLDGMLDKVQKGGLEGVIKQAAELQVLGGNFAMGADPLAMAYESYADPEAYAKRMNKMIAGQGSFDAKTGNVSFGITSQQIMRQFAESTGQDYKDVLNQARQQVKLGQISKAMDMGRFKEDQQALIANNATWNADTQSWTVKTGKDKDGKDIIKNVNELTEQDLETMAADPNGKPMEENIAAMRSTQEEMDATQKDIAAKLEATDWRKLHEGAEAMNNTIATEFEKNRDFFETQVREKTDLVVQSQKSIVDKFQDSINSEESLWNKYGGAIAQTASNISLSLGANFQSEIKKYITAAANNIVKQETSEFSDSNSDVAQFKAHMYDQAWLDRSVQRGTKEFEIMKRLYTNISGNWELLGGKDGIASPALAILSRWDPDGDVAHTMVTQKQKDALRSWKMGKGQKLAVEAMGGDTDNGDVLEEGSSKIKTKDGVVSQNGAITRIDSNDQVLAAKNGGPIDRMLGMVKSSVLAKPQPLPYDTTFTKLVSTLLRKEKEKPIKIEPLEININGKIELGGEGLTIDITKEIAKDPSFIRSISQMISLEVEKKIKGGRVESPLNRGLSWT